MREVIAKRAAKELHDGDVVNLGIGIPTLIPNYLPDGVSVTLQTENGAMGMGPTPEEGKEDKNLIKQTERDAVTGLYTQDYFFEYIRQIEHWDSDTCRDALVIDIERFHLVNEFCGRPFGDLLLSKIAEALEKELAYEDVAAVLTEPVMTNCGMVLPDEGYFDGVRELCDKYGSYLIIDETHTLSEGYGGCTRAHNLKPDFVTLGKSIAGGVPISVYGFTKEIADKIDSMYGNGGVSDPMGIGGTLAANQFAIACMITQLKEVATEEAFERMFAGLDRLAKGLEAMLKKHNVPWSITRSGARCEMQFMPESPRNGSHAKAFFDWDLMYYMHLYLHNRGLVITPFHNMMLISPFTTDEDIDRLIQGWDDCIAELVEVGTYKG